jgi:hypothetical protein
MLSWINKMLGNSSAAERLAASQEGQLHGVRTTHKGKVMNLCSQARNKLAIPLFKTVIN